MQVPLESGQLPCYASPWDFREGKYSQWAELQAVHLVIHFAWKEKWQDMQFYTNSGAAVNGLAGWLRTWAWLENWWQGELGKRSMDEILWMAKKMWRYFYLMWMLSKVWPQHKRILIIVYIGWLVLWILFPLFSHSCHCSKGSWTKWPWWERLCTGSATCIPT